MTTKGIDVSYYQGAIDWKKVKNAGINFVFIKATQGTSYNHTDYFTNNAPKALGNGLNVGAYHFATFSNVFEAKAEVHYFLSVVKPFKLTYPLVLDLETNAKNVDAKTLTDAAIAFLDEVKKAGYQAVFYSGKSFLESCLQEERINYPLWIARYGDDLGRKADIWQYSQTGKVDGINGNVDLDIAYRDFAPVQKLNVSQPPLTYTAQKGDSITKIANKYHTTVQALDKLNPSIKNLDLIYPGQKIRVK